MIEDTQHLANIVSELNDEIYQLTEGPTSFRPVQLVSSGDTQAITFFGVLIWNSDEDERDYNPDDDLYEPMAQFLRPEIQQVVAAIAKIQLTAPPE